MAEEEVTKRLRHLSGDNRPTDTQPGLGTDTEPGQEDHSNGDGHRREHQARKRKLEEIIDKDEPEGFGRSLKKKLTKVAKAFACSDAKEKEQVKAEAEEAEDSAEADVPDQPVSAAEYEGDVYNFTHPKRGRAIIINNEEFKTMAHRTGSECDRKALIQMFSKLGFDVKPVYQDLTAEQMKHNLKEEAKKYKYHKDADCLAVAILSHGDQVMYEHQLRKDCDVDVRQDVIFGVDGSWLSVDEIVGIFKDHNCPGLKGKPRLFFLQACRGKELQPGQDVLLNDTPDSADSASTHTKELYPTSATIPSSSNTATDAGTSPDETDVLPVPDTEGQITPKAKGKIDPTPICKDFMIMYATPPGFFSWRRSSGSWFVQSLHSVFMNKYEPSMTLNQALTKVVRMVAHGYEVQGTGDPALDGNMQTPVIQSMLMKDIYFGDK